MTKFAIKHVKGNEETILEVFSSKEEALKAGPKYRKRFDEGLISCIEAEFDSQGRCIGNSYKLHEVWR